MNLGNGIAIPGTSDSRFLAVPITRRPVPVQPLVSPSRVRFGPVRAGTVSDGQVTEQTHLSFYELLGIPETGTLVEVKQAYKQLARKYHPDVSPPDRVEEYTERFIRVQEAYETLSDPRKRVLYDRDLAKGLMFGFSTKRRHSRYDEDVVEDKTRWKNRWQDQLSELRRRSTNKEDTSGNMSWAARMRRQREEDTPEV